MRIPPGWTISRYRGGVYYLFDQPSQTTAKYCVKRYKPETVWTVIINDEPIDRRFATATKAMEYANLMRDRKLRQDANTKNTL